MRRKKPPLDASKAITYIRYSTSRPSLSPGAQTASISACFAT